MTPREREVLALTVDGVTGTEIAERLCMTEKTTATHIERILATTRRTAARRRSHSPSATA
jgi:DNA-binding CsgD family transcriptional regulator